MMPTSVVRHLPGAMLLVLTACTASWGRLVRYSSAPAVSSDLLVDLYAVVLREGAWPVADSVIIGQPRATAGLTVADRDLIPGHWADTLKREVSTALHDSAFGHPVSLTILQSAATAAGVQLAVSGPDSVPITPDRSGVRPTPRVTVWAPGFNRDSTIAAVNISVWCGMRCGRGETLYLARRPGHRWRIWDGRLQWIS